MSNESIIEWTRKDGSTGTITKEEFLGLSMASFPEHFDPPPANSIYNQAIEDAIGVINHDKGVWLNSGIQKNKEIFESIYSDMTAKLQSLKKPQ